MSGAVGRSRLVAFLAPVVAVSLVLTAGAFVPAMAPATVGLPPAIGLVSTACAAFKEQTSTSRVAVAPHGSVSVSALDGSDVPVGDAGPGDAGIAVLTAEQALRASGPTDTEWGASSFAASQSGPSRGLMMAACPQPATESWLVGVESNADSLTSVVLINIDNDEAAADLTFFGAEGEVTSAGARGIVVAPGTQRVIPLEALVSEPGPIAVRVRASQGRLAAVARDTSWKGTTPTGSDWVSASAPGTDVVIPGVPGGEGDRLLVVANPGDRSLTATIDALTAEGAVGLAGAATVEVPPHTTRTVSLRAGLAAQTAAIRIKAPTEIVAAVRSATSDPGDTSDFAVSVTSGPIAPVASLPVAAGTGAAMKIVVSNAGDEDATVTVAFTNAAGDEVSSTDVDVVAGGTVEVSAPAATALRTIVRSEAPSIHAAVVVTQTLGRVRGIATAPFTGAPGTSGESATHDPQVHTR